MSGASHYRVTFSNGKVREYPADCRVSELRRYVQGMLRLHTGDKVSIASITRRPGAAMIPLNS